jgi:hypothetical protein
MIRSVSAYLISQPFSGSWLRSRSHQTPIWIKHAVKWRWAAKTDMAAQEKRWLQTKSSGLGNAMAIASSRDALQCCPWHAVRMKSPRHAYQFGE